MRDWVENVVEIVLETAIERAGDVIAKKALA